MDSAKHIPATDMAAIVAKLNTTTSGAAPYVKYVKKDSSGNMTWESGTNRSYTTGSSSGSTTSDTWQ
ncbi:carbohydrate-binding module family 20 domain-containing protein [Streptomyces sp. NPDC048417]|uniref:carbohydrate-binding module family 20 domain-containing protein n=1 Tax=Streptomyces sp. NPDC048417 TaxID=3155387 RepID=UPI00343EE154